MPGSRTCQSCKTLLGYLQVAIFQLLTFFGIILTVLGYVLTWIIGMLLPIALGASAGHFIGWLLGYEGESESEWKARRERNKRLKKEDIPECGPVMPWAAGAVIAPAFHVCFGLYLYNFGELEPGESFTPTVMMGMSVIGTLIVLVALMLVVAVCVQLAKMTRVVWKKERVLVKEKVEGKSEMV